MLKTACVLCPRTPGARHIKQLPGLLCWVKARTPSNPDAGLMFRISHSALTLTQWSCCVRPPFVGMKTAACASIYTWIYSVCLWLLISVPLPSQWVHLNAVCCLKETELMANDIWQRLSVMVMWYRLKAAEARLRDVVWPWIHVWKQKTGLYTKRLILNSSGWVIGMGAMTVIS